MYSFSRKQMQAVDRAGGAVRGDRCVPWVRRMASAGVVAIGAVLLPALPAGAVVVHATTSSPTATHGVGHATGRGVGPALTGSQFNVTDLATNVTTTFQSSTVGVESGCGNSATFFCLGLGNGNAVSVTTVAPMASGQLLTAPDGGNAVTVTVEGRTCGEFQPQGGSYTAGVEVDQFDPSTLQTIGVQITCQNDGVAMAGYVALDVQNTTPRQGYYLYDRYGDTVSFGNDSYLNYLGGPGFLPLNQPVVSMAVTPDGAGYWMTAADGGVFAYGDAGFYGSTGDLTLNQPIVGMAATPDGKGYWFVAADGGVFAYGDAQFHGSTGNLVLDSPITGILASADGRGYQLVADDGGIFVFGDAPFLGSLGGEGWSGIVGLAA